MGERWYGPRLTKWKAGAFIKRHREPRAPRVRVSHGGRARTVAGPYSRAARASGVTARGGPSALTRASGHTSKSTFAGGRRWDRPVPWPALPPALQSTRRGYEGGRGAVRCGATGQGRRRMAEEGTGGGDRAKRGSVGACGGGGHSGGGRGRQPGAQGYDVCWRYCQHPFLQSLDGRHTLFFFFGGGALGCNGGSVVRGKRSRAADRHHYSPWGPGMRLFTGEGGGGRAVSFRKERKDLRDANRNEHLRGCSLLHGHGTFSTSKVGAWRLMVGGDWRLAVGRLVAVGGGWW